jgi:hypothetical protein
MGTLSLFNRNKTAYPSFDGRKLGTILSKSKKLANPKTKKEKTERIIPPGSFLMRKISKNNPKASILVVNGNIPIGVIVFCCKNINRLLQITVHRIIWDVDGKVAILFLKQFCVDFRFSFANEYSDILLPLHLCLFCRFLCLTSSITKPFGTNHESLLSFGSLPIVIRWD